tara:strand:+ start:1656 stop:2009 length:354 start_codon:yes stop_codon:yes gene_type:complete
MRIIEYPIPVGSHELAIWPDLPDSDTDNGEPIVTVCNLHHLSQDECVVTKAHGVLSDEINIAIGLKAHAMGYKVIHFKVPKGKHVSRWATFEKTINGMDFHRVDLELAISALEAQEK